MLVPPTTGCLLVKRGGSSITRSVPKPVVVVDKREPARYPLTRLGNWIAGVQPDTVEAGGYSVVGMPGLLALKRLSLPDLLAAMAGEREVLLGICQRLAGCR